MSEPEPLWREEFPVETAGESYVSRRQFAKFLVLGSAGMLAGNAWIAAKGATEKGRDLPTLAIARHDEIPVGGVKLFGYPTPDDPCLLVRLSEEEFVAFDQKCTHLSCAVYFDARTREIRCPCHEGRFSALDGRVLAGPPPRPLPRILLERRGPEIVAVGIDMQGGA
ncbi:MAG: Rieske (2Fe-2S) protein [Planctomycetes bacterium]|nr:Rieske (2Fe-2S) protein [Planctomycetota bacterium]